MGMRVVSIRVGRFDGIQVRVVVRVVTEVLSRILVQETAALTFEDFPENPYYVKIQESLGFQEVRTKAGKKRIVRVQTGKYEVWGYILIEDKSSSESDEGVRDYLSNQLRASIRQLLEQTDRNLHFLVESEIERSPGREGVDIREDRDEILRRAQEAGSKGVATHDPREGLS